jgi:hypothetical protein
MQVKVPDQPEGVEFSIRTPVTPQRWADFDEVCLLKNCRSYGLCSHGHFTALRVKILTE